MNQNHGLNEKSLDNPINAKLFTTFKSSDDYFIM